MRADIYAAKALNISRNQACELIKEQKIFLDNEIISKPSIQIFEGEVRVFSDIYVGRGALKLKSFFKNHPLDIKNKTALDVGSSTGGFVQILLENGAKSVVALDIGSSQLHESLKNDKRVIVHENTDIREFKSQEFYIVTCDVSFISLLNILPSIKKCANKFILFLFKPQFEVGKNVKRDKRGVVTDMAAILKARQKFELECAKEGLIFIYCEECKIKGKEGNTEYFYLFSVS